MLQKMPQCCTLLATSKVEMVCMPVVNRNVMHYGSKMYVTGGDRTQVGSMTGASATGAVGSNMAIGFACRRRKGDSHFAFASLRLKLFLHMHQEHYDVNLATSASKRRANQKSLVGVCVCVCVCVCVVLRHCGTPPPSTTRTRCCGDYGQCLVLLIGFWRPPPPSTKIRRCGDFG